MSKKKVYNHAIATKILDLMDKLRLDQNDNSSRRWIWELMQNAKDVAFDNMNVSIEINFQINGDEGHVEFKHNGKPFSTDNITFLIEQVSTKERTANEGEQLKTTGKFGTGFLTTHLLSELVEIDAVIKEPEEPYRKFSLTLDRSGREIEDIIQAVNRSLASLDDLDSQEPFHEYSSEKFNTVFRYRLDARGIEVATDGLKDLHTSLIFTLVFLPQISSLRVVHENIQYEINQDFSIENRVKIYTVTRGNKPGLFESYIAVLSNQSTSIAIEIEYINGNIYIKEFNPLVPRLFCDFPLVGTEDFPFPVIVNSPLFNPNEPRNGVYLTDRSDLKIDQNKTIMREATDLYYELLQYASSNNWGRIYLLAAFPSLKEKSWLSKKWYEDEIIGPIKEKLLKIPIVDTEYGRVSILNNDGLPNIWFPSSPKKDIRKGIWDLANQLSPKKLPLQADVDIWYKVIWEGCSKLTLEEMANSIQDKETLEKLGELVKPTNALVWLNSYYSLLNIDESSLSLLNQDKYMLIPNQNGEFKKHSELKIDRDIEEELKNVLSILDIDSRDYLIDKGISTGPNVKYSVQTQDGIVDEINKILKEGKHDNIGLACDYLITLFADSEDFPKEREFIYIYCKKIYPEDVLEKRKITVWSANIWQEVDKLELRWS